MNSEIKHVPQVVAADKLSDRQVMESLIEFTRAHSANRNRTSMTSDFYNILDGGVVLAGEAWRRGMLDPFLLFATTGTLEINPLAKLPTEEFPL